MTQDIPGTESTFPPRLHAKPVCRWVGGKRWMLRTLSNTAYAHLQRTRGRYIEPFLGGGAVALDLGLPSMILADTCEPLIHAYDQVRRFPQQVAWMLATYERRGVDKSTYLDVRAESPMSHIQRAAHFLYLNALCFNGVWRVNSNGVFNVAYGSKGDGAPAGKMRTAADLEQFAAAIKTSTLTAADFHKTLEHAGEGDFIYCFTPGSLVLCYDESCLPVENIKAGDVLWNGRCVSRLTPRLYTGTIYRIRIQGNPHVVSVTADHPFLAVSGKEGRSETRTVEELVEQRQLVEAAHLSVGDYVFLPTSGNERSAVWTQYWPKDEEIAHQAKDVVFSPDDKTLGRLIGYYAAEGFTIKHDEKEYGVSWTFNSSEREYIEDVKAGCKRVFGVDPIERPAHENVTTVVLHSRRVALFFARVVPGQTRSNTHKERRKTLHLCADLMTFPTTVQFEILVGWLRGDAIKEFDRSRGKGRLIGVGAVRELVLQMYRIAQRCGLRPYWRQQVDESSLVYQTRFEIAEEVERLGFAVNNKRQSCAQRRFVAGLLASRIVEITPVEYAGAVYGLTVDGDHLLCVDGVVSHNCDPPYFNTYDGYTTGRFTAKDHADLSEALRAAYDRGADLVTTNMDTPEVRGMYAWAAIQVTGEMHRVSCDPVKRGRMSTVLISTLPDLVGVEV